MRLLDRLFGADNVTDSDIANSSTISYILSCCSLLNEVNSRGVFEARMVWVWPCDRNGQVAYYSPTHLKIVACGDFFCGKEDIIAYMHHLKNTNNAENSNARDFANRWINTTDFSVIDRALESQPLAMSPQAKYERYMEQLAIAFRQKGYSSVKTDRKNVEFKLL